MMYPYYQNHIANQLGHPAVSSGREVGAGGWDSGFPRIGASKRASRRMIPESRLALGPKCRLSGLSKRHSTFDGIEESEARNY